MARAGPQLNAREAVHQPLPNSALLVGPLKELECSFLAYILGPIVGNPVSSKLSFSAGSISEAVEIFRDSGFHQVTWHRARRSQCV